MFQGAKDIKELEHKTKIALPQIVGIQNNIAAMMTTFESKISKPEVCREYLKKLVPETSATLFEELENNIKTLDEKMIQLSKKLEAELQAEGLKVPIAEEARLQGIITKTKLDEDVCRFRIRELEDELKLCDRVITEINEGISKDQKDLTTLLKNQTDQLLAKRQEMENSKRNEVKVLQDQNNSTASQYNNMITSYQGELSNAVEHKTVTEWHSYGYYWWWNRGYWSETKVVTIDKTNDIKNKMASAKQQIQEADQRLSTMTSSIEQSYQARFAKMDQDIRSLKDSATQDNQTKLAQAQSRIDNAKKSKLEVELKLSEEKKKINASQQLKTETTLLLGSQTQIVKELQAARDKRICELNKSVADATNELDKNMKLKEEKLIQCGCANTVHAIKLGNQCLALCEELQYYQVRLGSFITFANMFQIKMDDQIKKIVETKDAKYAITEQDISIEDVEQFCVKYLKHRNYDDCKSYLGSMVCGETVQELIDHPENAAGYNVPTGDKPFQSLWSSKWKPVISKVYVNQAMVIIDQAIAGFREIFSPIPSKIQNGLELGAETKQAIEKIT